MNYNTCILLYRMHVFSHCSVLTCMCVVSRSILATLMLAYLLPDTRTVAKSGKLIIFILVWKYICMATRMHFMSV